MPREASLFDETSGSPLEAYLLLRRNGGNIPPAWIDRASESRKKREKELASALKKNSLDALDLLRDWETAYRKECFYYGNKSIDGVTTQRQDQTLKDHKHLHMINFSLQIALCPPGVAH